MRDENDWECGWEDARALQLTAGFYATPAQRLAWLEEMIALAHRSGALPREENDRGSWLDRAESTGRTQGQK